MSTKKTFTFSGLIVLLVIAVGFGVFGSSKQENPPSHAATPSSTVYIKPQLTGIINQNGLIPTSYVGSVKAWDVQVKWTTLQPHSSTELITNTPIDQNGKSLDQDLQFAHDNGIRVFLDVLAGQFAPDWAKTLPLPGTTAQQAKYTICDDHGARTGSGTQAHCGTIPRFWQSNYQDDYKNLMQMLASRTDTATNETYDQSPTIAEVGIAGCMTIFNEPMVRQGGTSYVGPDGTNVQSFEMAGLTQSGDETCQHAQIDAMTVWKHTQSYLSFNPFEKWSSDTPHAPGSFSNDEAYTESLMRYCRSKLDDPQDTPTGQHHCVLGNESVGNKRVVDPNKKVVIGACGSSSSNDYSAMYTYIKCQGPPIQLRSSTVAELSVLNTNQTLTDTIPWAASLGAAGFEPPSGYDAPCVDINTTPTSCVTIARLSTSDVAHYNTVLGANAAPAQTSTCPQGQTGTPPNCVTPTCPSGQTGTPPNCVTPSSHCPSGQTGTPPHCVVSSTGGGSTGGTSTACCSTTSSISGPTTELTLPAGTDLSKVASVTYSLDGKVLAVETTTPFTYDLNTSQLTNGCHTLTTTILNKDNTSTTTTKQLCIKHPVKWYQHTAIKITLAILLVGGGGLAILLYLKPAWRQRLNTYLNKIPGYGSLTSKVKNLRRKKVGEGPEDNVIKPNHNEGI